MNPGRAMGVDFGTRRIGIALSDGLRVAAHPFAVLDANSSVHRRLAALIAAEEVNTVVVGLPVSLDGREGKSAVKARRFADRMRSVTDVEVVMYDERLTTRIAESVLLDAGTSRTKRRRQVDKVAAAVMLQGYLDKHRRLAAG